MKNFDYLIVGLGQTGLSCARFLAKNGVTFAVADTRNDPPALKTLQTELPNVPVYLGAFSDEVFQQPDVLVMSPGVSLSEPAIATALANNVKIVSDIDLFALEAKAPVIAVTGSNGKSTVVTLMGKMIDDAGKKAIVCGNIGLPVLDALSLPTPDYYVVELSSFQLAMTSQLKPLVATLLNISPDHLDRHADLDDYLRAKKRVFHNTQYAVVNADEPETFAQLVFQNAPVTFSLLDHASERSVNWHIKKIQNNVFLSHDNAPLIDVKELGLKGQHNWQNALAVLAMGFLLDLPMSSMLNTLKTFSGLPHRCQKVNTSDGVAWYNDSKATNVGAAVAAIKGIGSQTVGKCILIAGGDSKGVSLDDLKQPVSQYISHVITLGQDAEKINRALQGCTTLVSVNTVKEAVAYAASIVNPGDSVLLAPACASWDQYANYMERGNDFMKAVESHATIKTA